MCQYHLVIGVVPSLEDVAVRVEGGQEVDLCGGEQLRDGGVWAELLTEGPAQVQKQLPTHHLVPVDTWSDMRSTSNYKYERIEMR